jgi:HSP20 family protein
MSVIHYQPWHLVNRLHRDIENSLLFRDFDAINTGNTGNTGTVARESEIADWSPAVDVRETKDSFVLTADVPGVNPKDIEITTEKGVLTIRGTRQDGAEVNDGEKANEQLSYRIERANGRFVRRFKLPESAQAEAVTAKSNYGVLTLTIPKRAEVQPRRIEVQAA